MLTLFKKEFRQNGAFAVAMVFMCLLFQVAYYEMGYFFSFPIQSDAFFYIAIIVTALYAGGAAALAYSTEHADNTFLFLRKLPITQATIAVGKIGWVICGTLLVLFGNLLLTAPWGTFDYNVGCAFGIVILEMLVWGIFWSTRCRSQVHALLATYTCASVMAFVMVQLFVSSQYVSFVESYLEVVPHRLAALAVVAIFAGLGAFRWFRYETKSPLIVRLMPDSFSLFRYPRHVQSPFLGLIHHHLRHASLIYPLGIFCFALFSFGVLVSVFFPEIVHNTEFMNVWRGMVAIGAIICVTGTVLFWATIFGHDQQNDSYRYLSRLGIHEGKVWWSRMLPAMFFYFSVLVCWLVLAGKEWYAASLDYNHTLGTYEFSNARWWDMCLSQVSGAFTVWLAPAAVGAFISVSFRSQMVSLALTLGGICTLGAWAMLGYTLFGSNPGWTTLPICVALLVASRIRAAYWLREATSWRSRFIPLYPVFATVLAVCVALPFVRVYSLPYVSWKQIDAYFDQANIPMPRSPEKRKALIEYIAANNAVPPEYQAFFEELEGRNTLPYCLIGKWEHVGDCTYEEYMLLNYVLKRKQLAAPSVFERGCCGSPGKMSYNNVWRSYLMLWEQARISRALRIQIAALLAGSYGPIDEKAGSFIDLCQSQNWGHWRRNNSVFEHGMWEMFQEYGYGWGGGLMGEYGLCVAPVRVTSGAINRWFDEHGTLPESLDDLVGTPITRYSRSSGPWDVFFEIPIHPFTKEPVEYHRDAPPPVDVSVHEVHLLGKRDDDGSLGYNTSVDRGERERRGREEFHKSGGTYLRLGKVVCILVELPN